MYVTQMIVNGFLHFSIFKKIKFFRNFLHTYIEIDIYTQKVRCFIFAEKNIHVVHIDMFFTGVHSN